MSEIEIAKLLNVKVNKDTGQVFLEMEVTDPAWKQRILREWQEMDVKLVIEEKENIADRMAEEAAAVFDSYTEISEEDMAEIKKHIGKWRSK